MSAPWWYWLILVFVVLLNVFWLLVLKVGSRGEDEEGKRKTTQRDPS